MDLCRWLLFFLKGMGFASFGTSQFDPCAVMMPRALLLTYVVDLRKRWAYVCQGLIFGGQREQTEV